MNSVQLVGRFTRDPEIRYSQGDNASCIASFSIAVDRPVKSAQQTADFPNIVAFGKTAEFIEKYFQKGMRIGINGRLQTRSYDNRDGKKVWVTEVVAEHVEFVESKQQTGQQQDTGKYAPPANAISDVFMNIPDGIDEELPFS